MNVQRPALTLAGFGITFAGAILFSTKAVMVKLAFANLKTDPVTLLALRMVFALPFYLVIACWVGSKAESKPLTRRQWWVTIGLGLLGYYFSSLFDFLGLQYISAGLERLILFLYPTFALIINRFVYRQRILKNQVAAVVLTYAGIALAFFGELSFGSATDTFFLGCFLVLLCAITYSFYIVGSGRAIPSMGASRFTAYSMLAACAGVFLHYALAGTGGMELTSGAWGYGLALGVIATVIPSFLLSSGLKQIGSNNVAVISSIGPVSTILQAYFFLGEPIHGAQLAGTAMVVAGILLLGWKTAN